jgi:hypothetical protein
MQKINSTSQFKLIYTKLLNNIVDGISKEILEKLKDNINQYTYTYEHGDFYNFKYSGKKLSNYKIFTQERTQLPTFEFREAFEINKLKTIIGKVVSQIFYNYQSMSVVPKYGIHYDNEFGDSRKKLAEWLNIDGEFGGKERKPYFDLTLQWIDNNLFNLIDKHFKQNGIINWKRK